MLADLPHLIDTLRANPRVVGLVRYGSRRADDASTGGDFDLFVILKDRPPDVESIHFHVGSIPVDLNIRSIKDLDGEMPLTEIDGVLADGEVLLDRTEMLHEKLNSIGERWRNAPGGLAKCSAAPERFFQTHAIEKIRGRASRDPVLCHVVLAANVHWLLQCYLRVRCMPYRGEKKALAHLQKCDPEAYALVERFFAAHNLDAKLAITEELTERVLEPIGGTWKRGEVLSLPSHPDAKHAQEQGQKLFHELFGCR